MTWETNVTWFILVTYMKQLNTLLQTQIRIDYKTSWFDSTRRLKSFESLFQVACNMQICYGKAISFSWFCSLAILVHIPREGKTITGSAAESGCNWDRDGYKKWSEWTNEDFHYHEARSGMDWMEEKRVFFLISGGKTCWCKRCIFWNVQKDDEI